MMTIRYHAAGVTERRMWGSMQSWQDFCTTISILVGNFAILLGNFRSQTIIWITVKPEKRRWKFFCFNIQDSKTVFKWDQTRIATCETFYIEFINFFSLNIPKISENWESESLKSAKMFLNVFKESFWTLNTRTKKAIIFVCQLLGLLMVKILFEIAEKTAKTGKMQIGESWSNWSGTR